MPNKFREHLRKDVGIADSRIYELDHAIDSLHSAICKLDLENSELIYKHGLINLIAVFCKIEDLRDVTSILFDEETVSSSD